MKANLYSLKAEKSDFERVKITQASDINTYVRKFYSDDISIYESMFILILNRANKILGYAKISQGGVCGTVVDPIIICKYAVDALASSVILCHNHPSGNLKPSPADIQITEKVKQALKLFDCRLLDHVILSGDNEEFYSLQENGEM